MTVQTNNNSIAYVGNGSTVHFDYDFLILDDDHLKVYFGDVLQTSGYVVSGVLSQTGGTVAFAVAPPNGTAITLTRSVPFLQLTDYQPYDAFPAESHERALDLLTMMNQQLKDASDRSMQYPVGGNRWDAKNNEITNVAEGMSDSSAPNVGQVISLITNLAGPDSAAQLRAELAAASGVDLVGGAVKAALLSASGGAGVVGLAHNVAYAAASAGYRLVNAVYITDAPFNATPNTGTDQTANIQAAVAHAYSFSKPKMIVIPHGTFTVDGGIDFPAGKTPVVMGLGESSVLQRSVGSNTPILTFNDNFYLRDMFFAGAVDGGVSKAIKANAGNTAKLERNYFQLQDVGVELNASFAVEMTSNVFDVCKIYGVVSTTACHNLVLRNNNFFTCGVAGGGHAVSLQAATDNIIIDGNDFEYCQVNVRLTGATAVRISGNYMEYHKSACFDFVGTCYGVDIISNWIALGDAAGGGAVQNLANIVGGEFTGNTVYNQTINFASSLVGFDVGINTKTGTGTLGKLSYITPTLLNSWVQQASYTTVGYRKDKNGYVHIKGAVTGGSGQTIIFTLPAEYRPTDGTKIFACASSSGACVINVGTNGNVVALSATGNNPCFDGIYYYVG